MRQRTITAVFFTLAMLGGIYGGEHSFFVLFTLIVAGSAWELGNMVFKEEDSYTRLRKLVGMALPTILFVLAGGETLGILSPIPFEFHAILPLLFVFLATLELFLAGKRPFANIGAYLLSVLYLGIPMVLLAEMAHPGEYLPNRVLGLLLLVWINDVGAYLIGSRWGRNKLLERVSPKKTWEGSIGGAAFTILAAWGLSRLSPDFSPEQWLVLSAVAAIGSNIGDLVESMLKRSVGVKDSGTVLPGHGGLLDRFDAFIFCLPLYWLSLQLITHNP